ncbi:hypothetical protein M3651_19800 [Cytobacillus oceanisediminis]|nr:hypothetical protein [Cytobacillus oceanisediminis]
MPATKGNHEEQQKSIVISLNSSILRILSSSKYVPGWGIVTESNTQIYRVPFNHAERNKVQWH